MILASFQTRKVYQASKTSKYNKNWFALLLLVATFTLAYFISTILFFFGQSSLLIIAFGLILLLGAIFVYITMQLNLSTLLEIYSASNELKKYGAGLEAIVDQRSSDLERRVNQLRISAEISHIISRSKNSQQLLDQVVNLVKERFDLYYAGIFIVDENQQYASLKAGSGEAGVKMVLDQHRLSIEDKSMIGWSINHKQARIALDTGEDSIRFKNPSLPLTQSELAIPILLGTKTLGAMTVQSIKSSAFDHDDVIVFKNIADTLSIALENANLFNELKQKLEVIQKNTSQYFSKSWVSSEISSKKLESIYNNPRNQISDQLKSFELPLVLRNQVIGKITVDHNKEWSDEETAYIETISTQAVLALENVRLLEESKDIATREKLISEISNKVWVSPNTESILKTAIGELGRVLRADEATIKLEITDQQDDLSYRGAM
jgi:GAF domain-containing protein